MVGIHEYLSPLVEVLGHSRRYPIVQEAVVGIIQSGNLSVMNLSSFFSRKCKKRFYKAKPLYNLLRKADPEKLLTPLFHKSSEFFGEDEEIVVCLDTSTIEKPHSSRMENLARVVKKDKSGSVNGFTLISGIAVSGNKRSLVCHKVFSREAEGYLSDNKEHEGEITRARSILDRGRIIWTADRAYDSEFFFDLLTQNGDHFVIRAGKNRRVKVIGQNLETKLLDWAKRLSPRASFSVSLKKRKRRAKLELSWAQFLYKGKALIFSWS